MIRGIYLHGCIQPCLTIIALLTDFVMSCCYVYSHGTTYLSFCSLSLSDNKISADGVLVLAGALIVNRNLKLE